MIFYFDCARLSCIIAILFIHALTDGLLLCLGGSVAISFPVGTEVCSRPCLLLFSVYVRDAHLDIAYSFSLTTYVTCPQKKNNLCNLTYHLQWENIDKIKEFNWNFENLRGMVTDHNLVNSLCFLNVLPLQ